MKRFVTKLIRSLNRIWNRTPDKFAAIRIGCDGTSLTWSIAQRILTVTPVGGTGSAFAVTLDGLTIGALAGAIAGQTGFDSTLLAGENSGLSAFSLPDQSGSSNSSAEMIIYGASNLAWLYMDAVSSELETAQTQIAVMPSLMVTGTSEGEWLDFLGAFYNVPRERGELDTSYGPRIIAETIMPRGNNKAIEAVLIAALGQTATVTDVVEYGSTEPLYNGVITYNGAKMHNAIVGTPVYGLFDVTTAFDIINASSLPGWQTTVAALVERMRDAGTQMRSLTLTGSTLLDSLTGPSDVFGVWIEPILLQQDLETDSGNMLTTDTGLTIDVLTPGGQSVTTGGSFLRAVETTSDSLTSPADTSSYKIKMVNSDTLDSPSDGIDDLFLMDIATYSGRQTYSGSRLYSSGLVVSETIGGEVASAS